MPLERVDERRAFNTGNAQTGLLIEQPALLYFPLDDA